LIYTTSPVSEMTGPEPYHWAARTLIRALSERGWVEGKNLILERRSAEGRPERYEAILRELLGLKCDVIITNGTPMARVAKRVTTTVPIFMQGISDPVLSGLVPNLARPGGNATGLTDTGPELDAKRLELLKQGVPKASRVAVLVASTMPNPGNITYQNVRQAAAEKLGLTLVNVEFGPDNYSDGLGVIARERPDAIFSGPSAGLFALAKHKLIVDFAARNRIPLMGGDRIFPDSGALMSYGGDNADSARATADYIDRILGGGNPGGLPILRPQKFELVINLQTARALGLTIPESLLVRANNVIR